jgi:hypothetical protein
MQPAVARSKLNGIFVSIPAAVAASLSLSKVDVRRANSERIGATSSAIMSCESGMNSSTHQSAKVVLKPSAINGDALARGEARFIRRKVDGRPGHLIVAAGSA